MTSYDSKTKGKEFRLESSERTKICAVRKFPQNATVLNALPVCVKDKEQTEPALSTQFITSKLPKIDDFLTFLCFRGTSILPPSLNFYNVDKREEQASESSSLVDISIENQYNKPKKIKICGKVRRREKKRVRRRRSIRLKYLIKDRRR